MLKLQVFGEPKLVDANSHSVKLEPLPLLMLTYAMIEHQGEIKRETVCQIFFPTEPDFPKSFSDVSQQLYRKLWEKAKFNKPQKPTIISIKLNELPLLSKQDIESAGEQLKDYGVIDEYKRLDDGLNCQLSKLQTYLSKLFDESDPKYKIKDRYNEAIRKIKKVNVNVYDDLIVQELSLTVTDLESALNNNEFDNIKNIYQGEFLLGVEEKTRIWLSPKLRCWIETKRQEFAKQVSSRLQIFQEAKQTAKSSSSSEPVLEPSFESNNESIEKKRSNAESGKTVINNPSTDIDINKVDRKFRMIRNHLLGQTDRECREKLEQLENRWIDTSVSMSNGSFYSEKTGQVRYDDNCLVNVFLDRRLMVLLGKAGMGKTFVLYHIAQTLIVEARKDAEKPVPLIFHLADWESKGLSLENWFKNELTQMLLGKRNLKTRFESLLEEQHCVFLLDGFDNLSPQQRANRLQLINIFIEEYGLVDLGGVIIASRPEEYESAKQQFLNGHSNQLHFCTEATIQPLMLDESRAYIESDTRSQSLALDRLFQNDKFKELVNTPLWLFLFLKTAESHSATFDENSDSGVLQNDLISTYVETRFELNEPNSEQKPPYTKEQVSRWLGNIAQSIQMGGTFYIEALSPKMLNEKQQRLYQWWFTALFGIVFGAMMGSIAGLIFGKRSAEQTADKKTVLPDALMDIHQTLIQWIASDALIDKISLVISYAGIGIFSGLLMSCLTFLWFKRIRFQVFMSGYLALSLGITGLLCDGFRWFYFVVIFYGSIGYLLGRMIDPVHTNPLQIKLHQETLFDHQRLFNQLRDRLLGLLLIPMYQLQLVKFRFLNLVSTKSLSNRQSQILALRSNYEQLISRLQGTGLALSFILFSMLLMFGLSLFITKLPKSLALLQGFNIGLSITIGYSFYRLKKQSDWKTPVFWPTQKITLALKRSVFMILTIGGTITFIVTGLSTSYLGWPGNLSFGLRVGMPLGIILGFMFYGGVEVLKHFTLRWIMYT